ncbi:hypothetical protein BASA81_011333 [Batrachochytrium salamandrivorans]|nr:hypothetical protein BASA62_000159 [Batrachochytrium salamandrivorans]KAH9250823.1 hypothetical protein BASA81_011333 [Batrachochytrium salamandrivorans]
MQDDSVSLRGQSDHASDVLTKRRMNSSYTASTDPSNSLETQIPRNKNSLLSSTDPLLQQPQPKKLRVAFIHPDLGIGGAERLVVDAAVGLQSQGHTVTIYTSHHDRSHCFEETRDGTVSVHVFGDWLPTTFFGKGGAIVFAILRNLFLATVLVVTARNEFDVLFVDQLSVSIPILRLTDAKIMFYCHFPDKLLTKRESLLKKAYRVPFDFIEEVTTNMADITVVNSHFTASIFKDSFKTIETRPQVLYPGIHLTKYDTGVDLLDASVKQLVSTRTTIVSINRFERKKNIELAISAFELLKVHLPKQFAGLRLVIAGGYDIQVAENVEYLQELRKQAQGLGLSVYTVGDEEESQSIETSQVIFLPSFNDAQRTYLLATSLCLIYTPSHEHFGIVPVEAMYAQLPVVAVNNGGPTESVVHGVTGLLCESNPNAFSKAMAELVMDVPKKTQMGIAGRERILEKFSLDTFISSLELLLYQVMATDITEKVMLAYMTGLALASLFPIVTVLLLWSM